MRAKATAQITVKAKAKAKTKVKHKSKSKRNSLQWIYFSFVVNTQRRFRGLSKLPRNQSFHRRARVCNLPFLRQSIVPHLNCNALWCSFAVNSSCFLHLLAISMKTLNWRAQWFQIIYLFNQLEGFSGGFCDHTRWKFNGNYNTRRNLECFVSLNVETMQLEFLKSQMERGETIVT